MASSGSGVAGSATSNPTCTGAGNVAYFDGNPGDYIFSGTDTVTKGAWSGTASPTLVQIHVDAAGGPWWDWAFESSMLPGSPALTTQNYPNTERWPFESAGHPGMDVSGNGAGCNMSTGEFQIEAITLSAGTLKDFTATFVQYCDGSPPLHGCVHFHQ